MGLDLRDLLPHRGDGVPCVGAHAGCSRSRRGSMHLYSHFVLSRATDKVDKRRATHPSGWTCWVEKKWFEQAWFGLPSRLVGLVESVEERSQRV